MALLKYIAILLLAGLLIGCRTRTVYVPTTQTVEVNTFTEVRDTIVEYRLEYQRDTVTVADSVSFLSNSYGFSWAMVLEGKLSHSLTIWPDRSIPITLPLESRFTIQQVKESYPVYIEKELKGWQKILMVSGGIFLIVVILTTIRKLKRQ